VRIFHIFQHTVGTIGSFLKASVRVRKPRSRLRRKRKVRSFLVRAKYPYQLPDTSLVTYSINNVLVLKRRLQIRGKVVFGPTTYTIKRKKFLKSFARVL
jgi:ribosomal protein L14